MTNAFENAAIPTAVAILQAAKQFLANLGSDPLQLPAKLPGAAAVFVGTVQMQFPTLVGAEWGAVQAQAGTSLDGLITKLQAAHTA